MKRLTRSLCLTSATVGLAITLGASRSADGTPDGREAIERRFQELDRNKSGLVEREEFPGDDALWRRADRDGNGTMNLAEAIELTVELEVEKIFAKLDKDRDGIIRREELDPKDSEAARNFPSVDRDQDGQVTGAELLAALRARMVGPGSKDDAAKGAEPKLPPPWKTLLAMDQSGDGTLDRAELAEKVNEAKFAQLDANRDGKVEEAEYEAVRARATRIILSLHRFAQAIQGRGEEVKKDLERVDLNAAEAHLEALSAELRRLLEPTSQRVPH